MKEPIRVLQIATTMERAGLETMLMNYYRNIDRTKVQFDFLLHRDGAHAYSEEIRNLGGKIYSVPAFNPLNTNGYLTALDCFFQLHNDYPIVHSHLDCLSSIPLKYAQVHGIKARFAHSHACKMTFDAKLPIRLFYRSQIPNYATHLMACSNESGKWMFHKNDFSVVPNAIDCKAFHYNAETRMAVRNKYGLHDRFTIGHVGRFDPVKNHVFLLEIFREICCHHPNSSLVLAGTGPTMEAIREKAKSWGLEDNIIFLGSVSDVASILSAIDIFIFPSTYEGLGMSLIEAQASGCPCLTSLGRVPQSANVSGLVTYLPLEKNAAVWAQSAIDIFQTNTGNRQDYYHMVADAGYDIRSAAKNLENMYLKIYNDQV